MTTTYWRCLYCGDEIRTGNRCRKPTCLKKQRAAERRMGVERHASREEQHARYLDCGPQAWDDRDSEG